MQATAFSQLPATWNECLFRRPSGLQSRAFADGIRKRTIDDVGRIELLFDQTGAEIEIDGLKLFVLHIYIYLHTFDSFVSI